jgi:hypothetical protein
MKKLAALAIPLIGLAVSACGYALAGRGNSLPAYVKIIGVPQFVNQSRTADLDTILTEAVRQEFQNRGRFRVVADTSGVDALLTVTVQPIIATPIEFNAARLASKYTIFVVANVQFMDEHEKKPFWANPTFRVTEEYAAPNPDTVSDPSLLFSADKNALDRLARNFARTLVTSILESF